MAGPALAEPTSVTFWHAFSGRRETELKNLVSKFETANPEVKVELKAFTDKRHRGNDYAELYRNLTASLESKKPPVVSLLYENWVTQMADVKQLVALDKQMGTTWKDMPEVFVKASTHRDGKRYSIPFNKSLWVLYANRKLTQGIEPPQNWSDFQRAQEQLRAREQVDTFGVPAPFELFSMVFVSQGGRYFGPKAQPTFAGPVGEASARYTRDRLLKGAGSVLGFESYKKFSSGELPYLLDTSAKLSDLEDKLGDQLQVLPLPRAAGDKIQLTGTQLAVFSQSSPASKRAGIRLLRFLSEPEQTRSWSMATGYLPVRSSVYDDPVYVEYLKAKNGRAVVTGSLSRARVQPQVVGWEATRILINEALERVVYQDRPIEKELEGTQSTCARLIRGLQGR